MRGAVLKRRVANLETIIPFNGVYRPQRSITSRIDLPITANDGILNVSASAARSISVPLASTYVLRACGTICRSA